MSEESPSVNENRTCTLCDTILSEYNKESLCFYHAQEGRVKKRLARIEALHKIRLQKQEKFRVQAKIELVAQERQEQIIELVSKVFTIPLEILNKQDRRPDVVLARHVLMYLLYEDTTLGYVAVGKLLGGRDHTTVVHGVAKIRNSLVEDMNLAATIQFIRSHY